MKGFALIYLLTFSICSFAETAFEIPRSTVKNLKDSESRRTYPIFIKLPRSYRSSSDKAYPVVYMTDGSYSFQVMSGATRFPMNSGKMEEAIIVAISYATGSRGVSSRVRDYTPVVAKDWKMETGKAKEHLEFIASDVIPFIESNYRTQRGQRTFCRQLFRRLVWRLYLV